MKAFLVTTHQTTNPKCMISTDEKTNYITMIYKYLLECYDANRHEVEESFQWKINENLSYDDIINGEWKAIGLEGTFTSISIITF